jgi:hypothetical protein
MAIVVLDIFHIAATRHITFDMPVLTRRHGETEIQIIPAMVTLTFCQ